MTKFVQALNQLIADRKAAKAAWPQETSEEFNARIEKQHREMSFQSYQWAGSMGTSREKRGSTLTAACKSFTDDIESVAIPSSN